MALRPSLGLVVLLASHPGLAQESAPEAPNRADLAAPAENSAGGEDSPAAEAATDETWRANIDRFLARYLPSESADGVQDPDAAFVYDLPAFTVETYEDAPEGVRQELPDMWDLMSADAQRRWAAEQRLRSWETKVLNRWILPWGVRPETLAARAEEYERQQAFEAHNAHVLDTLRKVRPDLYEATFR